MRVFTMNKSDNLIDRHFSYMIPATILLIIGAAFGLMHEIGRIDLLLLLPSLLLLESGRIKARKTLRDESESNMSIDSFQVMGLISIAIFVVIIVQVIGFSLFEFIFSWVIVGAFVSFIEDGVAKYMRFRTLHKIKKLKNTDFSFLKNSDGIVDILDGVKVKRTKNNKVLVLIDSRVYHAKGVLSLFVNNSEIEDRMRMLISLRMHKFKNLTVKFL